MGTRIARAYTLGPSVGNVGRVYEEDRSVKKSHQAYRGRRAMKFDGRGERVYGKKRNREREREGEKEKRKKKEKNRRCCSLAALEARRGKRTQPNVSHEAEERRYS